VVKGLKKSLPERYHSMIPENEKALIKGAEVIKEIQKV
jgi:2-oxoglutarate ferredoxin oxidoreductase subunit gamma